MSKGDHSNNLNAVILSGVEGSAFFPGVITP